MFDTWHTAGQPDGWNPAFTGSDTNGNALAPSEYAASIYGDPEWQRSLGYTPPSTFIGSANGDEERNKASQQQALDQWLASKGYALKIRNLPGENLGQAQYFDGSGNPVGMLRANNTDPDNQFGTGAMIAAAILSGGLAAAGGAGGAAGAASAEGAGGLSSADLASLYGPEGYGAGMTDAETAAYDGTLGGVGMP